MIKSDKIVLALISLCAIVALTVTVMVGDFRHHDDLLNQKSSGISGIQAFTTKSGLRVYYDFAKEIPMVDFRLMVDAGSIHDKNLPGLALLTNQMLNQGTTEKDVDMIADGFDEVGAQFTSQTEADYASISLRSLTDDNKLQPAFDLWLSLIAKPNFPSKQFEVLQSQLLATLRFNEQNPGIVGANKFRELVYATHPYSQSTLGNKESLKKITPNDLQSFFQNHYGIAEASLAIVGHISREKAELLAEKIAQVLLTHRHESMPLLPPKSTLATIVPINFSSNQTHIMMGTLGLKRGDPDFYAMLVGNQILGGSFVSRLFKTVRTEKGLAYNISSSFNSMRENGTFVINLQTRNQKREAALDTVRQVLNQFVKEGPTGKEVADAKRNLIGSFPLAVSSNGSLLNYLSIMSYYRLPVDYLSQYKGNIEKISVSDVKEVFRRRIDTAQLVTVTVGPT